jgi:toxin FitB
MMSEFGEHVLAFDVDCAQMWGRLRVPNEQHALDKQFPGSRQITP